MKNKGEWGYKDLINYSLLEYSSIGGDETTMAKSISDYESKGDSVSMAKIDSKPFTPVKIEKTMYDGQESRVVTTMETFEVDDNEGNTIRTNRLHTTRKVIVDQLDKILPDLEKGEKFKPMRCEKQKAKKGGKDYWQLVDA